MQVWSNRCQYLLACDAPFADACRHRAAKGRYGDEFDCIPVYCAVMAEHGFADCPHLDQIQIMRLDSKLSQGPIWARGLGEAMVLPEHEFCMQVNDQEGGPERQKGVPRKEGRKPLPGKKTEGRKDERKEEMPGRTEGIVAIFARVVE